MSVFMSIEIIEVEIRVLGRVVKENASRIKKDFVLREYHHISKGLRSLTCVLHGEIPIVELRVLERRWVAEIKCCCECLKDQVSKRLNENFTY